MRVPEAGYGSSAHPKARGALPKPSLRPWVDSRLPQITGKPDDRAAVAGVLDARYRYARDRIDKSTHTPFLRSVFIQVRKDCEAALDSDWTVAFSKQRVAILSESLPL